MLILNQKLSLDEEEGGEKLKDIPENEEDKDIDGKNLDEELAEEEEEDKETAEVME